MLKFLVDHSIRYRGIVVVLACVLLGYGLYTAQHAKLDVFPDFVEPQGVIQTEAPGLSPEQVEELVTRPVENAVAGISFLESIRSQSIEGLSIVTVVFAEGTNLFTARQMVTEQLGTVAGELPEGVKSPKLTPLTSATMDLLKMGIVSETKSLMELRAFADWTLRPRLQAVPGVADVGIMGGDVRQIQIQVDPERLLAHGMAIEDVMEAARLSTGARGAGWVETDNQRIILQSEGQSLTPEQLGEVIVSHDAGRPLRLKDVANVVTAPELKFGDAIIQGRPGVLVKILSQYGSNTMEVTEGVETALDELQPALTRENVTIYPRMHRPATFIEVAIHHVKRSLLIGGVLVVIVLFLFLLNLRTAFISMTAIPLSLLVAVIVLDYFGITLNTITLGGLAIAIGEVVDDAIIDVENIYRRLQENGRLDHPKTAASVVLDASLEVRGAVVYATFVVVLVFVPVLTMSGLQGRMFAPLGQAYIVAILASLLIALTITPALCMLLLPSAARKTDEPMLLRRLKAAYEWLMRPLIRHPYGVGILALGFCVSAAFLFRSLGGEFLPEFREGHFVLQVSTVPGTSLPQMMRLGKHITDDLLENIKIDGRPVIDTVEQQAGRAELGEDPWGPHRSEFHVELKPDLGGTDQAEVQEQIRDLLEKYPGITYEVLTFLGDRISETVSGETSPVVVNLFGNDLDALDEQANGVASILSGIRGATDVSVASPPGAPYWVIQLRRDRMTQLGFRTVEVLSAIQTAYQGLRVAQTYEGSQVFDVVVILDPGLRRDAETVGSLLLRSPGGTFVRLSELADLTARTGRYMVLHEGGRRRQTITCDVESRDLTSFVEEVRQKVAATRLPGGMYAEFGGESEVREAAASEFLLHSGIAALGIVLLLSTVFHSIRNLLLVLVNLPFALVGGVLAVYLTGGTISIGSLVGFVTLFGITTRNSIMLISHVEHLVRHEGVVWGEQAILRGASERLIPILMTAAVTGLGLLPIALGTGEPGREIEGPMAVVILGGLVSSTLLNLLVLPSLTYRFGARAFQVAHGG